MTLALDAIADLHHPVKVEAAEWARESLHSDDLLARDKECLFWVEGWDRAARHGITALMVDPAYGGQGKDVFTTLLTFEGLGYGCNDAGLLFGLATQVWTMQPIIERFGSEAQRRRYLPGLCSGELRCSFTITEAGTGSDTFAMSTRFDKSDDGASYLVNGEKAYVTMAPEADVFIVFATSDPKLGQWGVSVFLIDADTPGLHVGPNEPKMGLRTAPFANVLFDNCEIGAECRLGPEGSGASIFTHAMEAERGFVLAAQIGAMERQLAQAVTYSHERKQFGKAIGEFQAVAHRLADMRMRHETARLLLYKAAILVARGASAMEAATLAKLAASEGAITSSVDALLIHGARGYQSEYGVERDLRNVAGGIVYGGTSDIQRNIVARLLEGLS